MIPFLESAGGNCQDAVILVEELAVTVKLVGDPEGTAIGKRKSLNYVMTIVFNRPAMQDCIKKSLSDDPVAGVFW